MATDLLTETRNRNVCGMTFPNYGKCMGIISVCHINSFALRAAYMQWWTRSALVQVMACHLFSTKPLPEPMMTYHNPRSTKLKGVYWSHLVRPSVCPSVDRIVSTLYLLQYLADPFHIYIPYQATSEGVSRVKCFSKLKKMKFWHIL